MAQDARTAAFFPCGAASGGRRPFLWGDKTSARGPASQLIQGFENQAIAERWHAARQSDILQSRWPWIEIAYLGSCGFCAHCKKR